MIPRAGALLAAILLACAGAAGACPAELPGVLFHSCAGQIAAELRLLPEEPLPEGRAGTEIWALTGVYTAGDRRAGGLPKPVGLFVDGGRVVNPNLARMDGVLLVAPDGALSLHHRARVSFAGRRHDLRTPEARLAFAREAARRGHSVAQSHLLIVDGRVDVRPSPDAPRFTRRVLFTDAEGFGVWQSPAPMTLHAASLALAEELAPRMALNLDMGSYDLCWHLAEGRAERCGLLPLAPDTRLSNLLVFTRPDA